MSDAPDWVTQLNERLHDLENSVERRTTDQNIKDLTQVCKTKLSSNGNNAAKGVGTVIIVVSILVGFVGIAQYMSRENDYIRKDIIRIEQNLKDTNNKVSSTTNTEAKLQERFKEVETQFKALREVVNMQEKWDVSNHDDVKQRIFKIEEWLEWWNRNVPGLDSEQNVKLNYLNKFHYETGKEENNYKGKSKGGS